MEGECGYSVIVGLSECGVDHGQLYHNGGQPLSKFCPLSLSCLQHI